MCGSVWELVLFGGDCVGVVLMVRMYCSHCCWCVVRICSVKCSVLQDGEHLYHLIFLRVWEAVVRKRSRWIALPCLLTSWINYLKFVIFVLQPML